MIVARPINNEKNDLLVGHEHKMLVVRDLEGKQIHAEPAPRGDWTHDALEAFDYDSIPPYGWDAYLGFDKKNWIGGSEV